MKTFRIKECKEKNLFILNLEPGDLLLESIKKFVQENFIKHGCVISGIGTLKKLRYHRVLNTNYVPENEYLTIEGAIELSALQGLIINYEPHLHFVASDLEKTYSGHLEDGCEVLYLSEILLLPLEDIKLKRIPDKRNVTYITLEE